MLFVPVCLHITTNNLLIERSKKRKCARDESEATTTSLVTVTDAASDEADKCVFCFLSPCITLHNAEAIVGAGQAASDRNPPIRKQLYRRFWHIIDNVGGWNTPQYLRKKAETGGQTNIVQHRREIMPECVLKIVRQKFPNPAGKDYMGHHWE